jgi:hypothetical protein
MRRVISLVLRARRLALPLSLFAASSLFAALLTPRVSVVAHVLPRLSTPASSLAVVITGATHGSIGFESAVALALALDRGASIEHALANYERDRRPRTTAVTYSAALSTMLAGLGGPAIDTCRDLLLQPGWATIGHRLVQAIAAR